MVGDHPFGGEHTEVKLRIVKAYLQSWIQVLKNQNYERIYIDPFAGTGLRTIMTDAAPLLGEKKNLKTWTGPQELRLP